MGDQQINRPQRIALNPLEPTQEIMQMLEDQGLIYRLYPGHHTVEAKEGEILEPLLYEGEQEFGPHQLITLTMNRGIFDSFGFHPDNEEFILLGDPKSKPLYLLISLIRLDEFKLKVLDRTLKDEDFITLRLKYNDPYVSFFTMRKNVPHGEAVGISDGVPPSFYVTRSAGFDVELIDMGNYVFELP